MDIIPATAPKCFTSETTFQFFFNWSFILKNPKLYGMDKITTEEVMDKLDMF